MVRNEATIGITEADSWAYQTASETVEFILKRQKMREEFYQVEQRGHSDASVTKSIRKSGKQSFPFKGRKITFTFDFLF